MGGVIDLNVSQGVFHVKRRDDGRLFISCPPLMIVPAASAIEMARALLSQAGAQLIEASPGQVVVTPGRKVLG